MRPICPLPPRMRQHAAAAAAAAMAPMPARTVCGLGSVPLVPSLV